MKIMCRDGTVYLDVLYAFIFFVTIYILTDWILDFVCSKLMFSYFFIYLLLYCLPFKKKKECNKVLK